MTVNERIRYFRKKVLNMTQQEFSSSINMSRSNMGNIETGEVAVTDRVLVSICEKYNANIDWLKKGTGDPIIPKTKNQIITDFLGDLIKEDDESFRKRIIEALASLEVQDWEILKKIALAATRKED